METDYDKNGVYAGGHVCPTCDGDVVSFDSECDDEWHETK